jgi:hypothetical protein
MTNPLKSVISPRRPCTARRRSIGENMSRDLVVNGPCTSDYFALGRVRAAPDLGREGMTGHVVHRRDVQALGDRLGDRVANPLSQRGTGEAARAHAADWSYEHAASGIAAVDRAAAAGDN